MILHGTRPSGLPKALKPLFLTLAVLEAAQSRAYPPRLVIYMGCLESLSFAVVDAGFKQRAYLFPCASLVFAQNF